MDEPMGEVQDANREDFVSNGHLTLNIKTMDQQTHTLHAPPTMVVADFKKEVEALCNVPVDRQRLIYQGKVLKDEKQIKDYNVENEHTILLVARPEGEVPSRPQEVPRLPTFTQGGTFVMNGSPHEVMNAIMNRIPPTRANGPQTHSVSVSFNIPTAAAFPIAVERPFRSRSVPRRSRDESPTRGSTAASRAAGERAAAMGSPAGTSRDPPELQSFRRQQQRVRQRMHLVDLVSRTIERDMRPASTVVPSHPQSLSHAHTQTQIRHPINLVASATTPAREPAFLHQGSQTAPRPVPVPPVGLIPAVPPAVGVIPPAGARPRASSAPPAGEAAASPPSSAAIGSATLRDLGPLLQNTRRILNRYQRILDAPQEARSAESAQAVHNLSEALVQLGGLFQSAGQLLGTQATEMATARRSPRPSRPSGGAPLTPQQQSPSASSVPPPSSVPPNVNIHVHNWSSGQQPGVRPTVPTAAPQASQLPAGGVSIADFTHTIAADIAADIANLAAGLVTHAPSGTQASRQQAAGTAQTTNAAGTEQTMDDAERPTSAATSTAQTSSAAPAPSLSGDSGAPTGAQGQPEQAEQTATGDESGVPSQPAGAFQSIPGLLAMLAGSAAPMGDMAFFTGPPPTARAPTQSASGAQTRQSSQPQAAHTQPQQQQHPPSSGPSNHTTSSSSSFSSSFSTDFGPGFAAGFMGPPMVFSFGGSQPFPTNPHQATGGPRNGFPFFGGFPAPSASTATARPATAAPPASGHPANEAPADAQPPTSATTTTPTTPATSTSAASTGTNSEQARSRASSQASARSETGPEHPSRQPSSQTNQPTQGSSAAPAALVDSIMNMMRSGGRHDEDTSTAAEISFDFDDDQHAFSFLEVLFGGGSANGDSSETRSAQPTQAADNSSIPSTLRQPSTAAPETDFLMIPVPRPTPLTPAESSTAAPSTRRQLSLDFLSRILSMFPGMQNLGDILRCFFRGQGMDASSWFDHMFFEGLDRIPVSAIPTLESLENLLVMLHPHFRAFVSREQISDGADVLPAIWTAAITLVNNVLNRLPFRNEQDATPVLVRIRRRLRMVRGRLVEAVLSPDLTPQQFAENFYRCLRLEVVSMLESLLPLLPNGVNDVADGIVSMYPFARLCCADLAGVLRSVVSSANPPQPRQASGGGTGPSGGSVNNSASASGSRGGAGGSAGGSRGTSGDSGSGSGRGTGDGGGGGGRQPHGTPSSSCAADAPAADPGSMEDDDDLDALMDSVMNGISKEFSTTENTNAIPSPTPNGNAPAAPGPSRVATADSDMVADLLGEMEDGGAVSSRPTVESSPQPAPTATTATTTPAAADATPLDDDALLDDLLAEAPPSRRSQEPTPEFREDDQSRVAFGSLTKKERTEWKRTIARDEAAQAKQRPQGEASSAYSEDSPFKRRRTGSNSEETTSAAHRPTLSARLQDVSAAAAAGEENFPQAVGDAARALQRSLASTNPGDSEEARLNDLYRRQLLQDVQRRLQSQNSDAKE